MSATADEVQQDLLDSESPSDHQVIPLSSFIADFSGGLLDAVQNQNPPVYTVDQADPFRDIAMDSLKRAPFDPQRDVVQAVCSLLIDHDETAAVINAEMGTGKTMMAIATAACAHAEGMKRFLVLSPPHLVYKWRREILETVNEARVWILNGPDTLRKLLKLRSMLGKEESSVPEFFILGRVRMRMGFHWRPVITVRRKHYRRFTEEGNAKSKSFVTTTELAACPACGEVVKDEEGEPIPAMAFKTASRSKCSACEEPLWTLTHATAEPDPVSTVRKALRQIPTIGVKTADRLLQQFGVKPLSEMLADNVYEFINLMDDDGELVFSDRQSARMERAMARLEFSFGQGGYQPTEFIKRQLPKGYFDLLIVDEGHEYKASGSAQGQAMGVLASQVKKVLLLTGTLMGGYADDLFYLLWRVLPQRMIEDGYTYNANGSLGSAAMTFMRDHGVIKDIYSETEGESHRTARGKKVTHRTQKGPGFSPLGIVRYVLPFTAFLKLRDLGSNVLPPYQEHFIEVPMEPEQASAYNDLTGKLRGYLKEALRKGDTTLMGVVLNVLLAWPETCFRPEVVKHPRTRDVLAFVKAKLGPAPSPKEEKLLDICREAKEKGRRVLVYTTYTGTRDTASRLKTLLTEAGFKAEVLRASVDTSRREEWLMDKVDAGVDVVITNPELVKTGLDLLDFPDIVFMQTGYNVYTLQQAARRSWRIGQQQDVHVYFLGYFGTTQIDCLTLMAKKIAVAQSTSGDMPETGLEVLNQDGDSIEIELARQLAA